MFWRFQRTRSSSFHSISTKAHRQDESVKRKLQEEALASLLRRCTSAGAVSEAHTRINEGWFSHSPALGELLIHSYARFGCLSKAQQVFDKLPHRTTTSWTALIAAYARNRHLHHALAIFKLMDSPPSRYTFINILSVCGELQSLVEVCSIHAQLLATAGEILDTHISLQNSLLTAYSKCGRIHTAEFLFSGMPVRDVVSWNSMISAYAQNQQQERAVDLYLCMRSEGAEADEYTFSTVLSACYSYEQGRRIHSDITSAGDLFSGNTVVQNALINMYARCDRLPEARAVFDSMPRRNVISWSAIIGAYTQKALNLEAILLFRRMDLEGVKPNNVTFATVVTACSNEGLLVEGRFVHLRIINPDFVLQNTLLNLYGKCGKVQEARRVFDSMKTRTVITWTSMIGAFSQQGHTSEALETARDMILHGFLPNLVTSGCILVACSYGGLHDQARLFFSGMRSDFGLEPQAEHYICMIDALGRAGRVAEAEELIGFIPGDRVRLGWMALLGACRIENDPERGNRAAEQAFLSHRREQSGLLSLLFQVFCNKPP